MTSRYCWIDPPCGCSICIGPPGEHFPIGLGGGLRSRVAIQDAVLSAPILCLLLHWGNRKKRKACLEGYLSDLLRPHYAPIIASNFSRSFKHQCTRNLRKCRVSSANHRGG